VLIVPNRDPGVKVLHGTVKIFFGSGCDDMVMVRHEDDVVDEKVIFFMGFLQCLEKDVRYLALVEPERSVVGSADQVVG